MRHLRKYFENIESVDPIDVEMDVIEFRKKFSNTFNKYNIEFIDKILNKLVVENPTMTDEYKIFRLWNIKLYSKPDYISSILLRAVDKEHALVKLSLIRRSNKLFPIESKNWSVGVIDEKEIKLMIMEIESEKEFLDGRLKNIINIR